MDAPQPDHKNWISELAGQSWNLEMLISGAAIFSTSFLPEITESALDAYFENYQTSDDVSQLVVPVMAYGFAETISYLLIATFIGHFVLRAFWVGMVGLRAVYPEGIIYEKLPKVNDQIQEIYRKQFGDSDDFIVSLDRLCSQLFSIAFVLVLFGIMMSMLYLIGFILAIFFKSLTPEFYEQWGEIIKNIVTAFFLILGVSIMVLSQKRMREHPFWGKVYTQVAKSSSWMYMGLYKPISYILLTFASHVPLKKYYTFATLMGLMFFSMSMFFFVRKTFEYNGLPWLEPRQYFSSGTSEHRLMPNNYDNLRTDEEAIDEAAIQADIIREPFLKVFINYVRRMDTDVEKICQLPEPADSLRGFQKRLILDKAKLACLQKYFQISINDSTYQEVELMFEKHGVQQTEGLTAYIPTQNCKIGRNTLYIKTMATDSLPKTRFVTHVAIPFWYAPEN